MSADTQRADARALVLGVRSLARLACLPRSRVRAAMDDGRLDTLTTDALRGRTCHYVRVDSDRFDAWLAHQSTPPVYLDELEVPRTNGGFPWFYTADVRRAASEGHVQLDRRDRVAIDAAWLRWAAGWMPEGERAAVVGTPCEHP